MQELVEALVKQNLTISSSESITGGLFASSITSVPGVSSVYKGSVVVYQNEIKESILGIDHSVIVENGVVSKAVALEMVKSTKKLFNSDIAISFTGNAGPSNLESKPVGLWFLGVAFKDDVYVYEFLSKGSRDRIRKFAVKKASQVILDIIRKKSYSNVL